MGFHGTSHKAHSLSYDRCHCFYNASSAIIAKKYGRSNGINYTTYNRLAFLNIGILARGDIGVCLLCQLRISAIFANHSKWFHFSYFAVCVKTAQQICSRRSTWLFPAYLCFDTTEFNVLSFYPPSDVHSGF
ncbi:hypothetical protein AN391_03938 [Pseudoalteromonas sp. P1-13-1a]|nr:hypothetical protein AN391_03938 [Pseudoalteromonas sp. P1-13-1a]